jgi:hypothetical protein
VSKSDLERLVEKDYPPIPVVLDAGTFEWLHDMVRRKSEQHQWVEAYRALTHRALSQFDEAVRVIPGVPTPARTRVIPPRKVARKKRPPVE